MANGGDFGADEILWIQRRPVRRRRRASPLDDRREFSILADANIHDWADVEPSIFGTLFERTLDPAKRSQIGAHYTSREDIETLLEPVVMAPLRREWAEAVQEKCDELLAKDSGGSAEASKGGTRPTRRRNRGAALRQAGAATSSTGWRHVTVLDPACGSGNFLYVAISCCSTWKRR